MKKVLFPIIAFIILFVFTSCGTTSSTLTEGMELSKNAVKFYSYVEKGDFEKATDIFENEILQTYAGEAELRNASMLISQKVNNDYLKGIITKQEAENMRAVLDDIKLYVCFDDPAADFDDICLSKESYSEGTEKFNSAKYIEAIEKLEFVRSDDCNYDSAQSMIDQSKESYKEEVLVEFNSKIDNDELIEGVKFLKESMSILNDDAKIISLMEQYEKEFTDEVIKQAKSACINVATDWEAAVKIIKQAQQHLPDNEILQKQREHYEQYEPVSLFDMHLLSKSQNFQLSTVTDNIGNTYENAMAFSESGRIKSFYNGEDVSNPMESVHILDKKYNVLKFTVAVGEYGEGYNPHSGCDMTIRIYGDGKKIYDAGDLKGSTRPFEAEVDVTGVSDLKVAIVCNAEGDCINRGRKAIFANPMLQRTVK